MWGAQKEAGAASALAERLQATPSCPSARSPARLRGCFTHTEGWAPSPGLATSLMRTTRKLHPPFRSCQQTLQSPTATASAFSAACCSVSSVSAQRFDLFFFFFFFLSCHALGHFAREQVEITHFTRKSQHRGDRVSPHPQGVAWGQCAVSVSQPGRYWQVVAS